MLANEEKRKGWKVEGRQREKVTWKEIIEKEGRVSKGKETERSRKRH